MNWLALSVKDWQRRPLRTSVTAAGVAIAVAALFSLLSFHDGYRDGVRRELDRLGAHILVVPKGCPYDAASIALHGASWPCYLKSNYLAEVRSAPGIASAAPAFMSALYNDAGEQTVYVGIDESMSALRRGWRMKGQFPKAAGELLTGAEASRRNQWKIGDAVRLPGLNNETGIVSAVLEPIHGADDAFIYLRLADAQRIFQHQGELTHILVRLTDPNELDHAVTALRGCDAGMDMNIVPLAHLFRTIQTLVNSTRVLLGCVAAIALLIATAGVSNTVFMAVAERTREIGVMRAIGASRADVFRLFWMETLQVCAAGGAVGIALAFVASRGVESWLRAGLPFAPTDVLIRWDWGTVLACFAGALLVGSIAGLLPAGRAARFSPMQAIREGGQT
jgi:putative ABC transport system permease protein